MRMCSPKERSWCMVYLTIAGWSLENPVIAQWKYSMELQNGFTDTDALHCIHPIG